MSKPKGWTKRNRVFLNVPGSGCMAGVAWYVTVQHYKNHNHENNGLREWKAEVCANIEINDEGQNHYVDRRAALRPLRTMRKELDAFEEACQQAIEEVEEYNRAKS